MNNDVGKILSEKQRKPESKTTDSMTTRIPFAPAMHADRMRSEITVPS